MNPHVESLRAAARRHQSRLPNAQRKRLGQHFSGLQIGRLLTHLALDARTRTVLDPMAGNGDLLDATWEAATECGLVLERLDGVEIHDPTADVCRERLRGLLAGAPNAPASDVIAANAFAAAAEDRLAESQYDLVITNPPYVRYQGRADQGICDRTIRHQLQRALATRQTGPDAPVWRAVADGYSGLADLSIPAWLLAAMLVRAGGRLAIVVPATWRSRDYADVIRFLMSHCFEIERIVEGPRSTWFTDALVRTHLVVARRRLPASCNSDAPVCGQQHSAWIRIGAEVAAAGSLVGASFRGPCSERRFSTWLHKREATTAGDKPGIVVSPFDLENERKAIDQIAACKRWHRQLCGKRRAHDDMCEDASPSSICVPNAIAELLPDGTPTSTLTTLDQADIAVGQGLRTGCNAFFYVTAVERGVADAVVETASLFGRRRFAVPNAALRPVIRRQTDLAKLEEKLLPDCHVLDLRSFALPEDMSAVFAAESTYRVCGEEMPRMMPADLSDYVRLAARTAADGTGKGKPIPELSAVRTNLRPCRPGKAKPRFWYMLPNFAPRHLPAVAIPRVNHGLPWAEANRHHRLLVDANFATVWARGRAWTPYALKALLNSTWCRTAMETLCTPMGGGALKVEATHLRRLPLPQLSKHQRAALTSAGRRLTRNASTTQATIDDIVLGALCSGKPQLTKKLAKALHECAINLVHARRT